MDLQQKYGIFISRAIFLSSALVKVIKVSPRKIILPRHTEIGLTRQLHIPTVHTCNIASQKIYWIQSLEEDRRKFDPARINIGSGAQVRDNMIQLCFTYSDVFCWTTRQLDVLEAIDFLPN